MAELNLKQIIDRLNAEFTCDTRKLVFWYDDKAEFAEDIESVELENAKVYLDISLNRFDTVFPACGSSNSAIELTIEELQKYSHYIKTVDVCKAWQNETEQI